MARSLRNRFRSNVFRMSGNTDWPMNRKWARIVLGSSIALLVVAIVVRWLFWQELLYILGGGMFR